jgi:hypothetical protein
MSEPDFQNPIAYCVTCVGRDGSEVTHIFSSPARRQSWAERDERTHVFFDYEVNNPDRFEKPLPKAN